MSEPLRWFGHGFGGIKCDEATLQTLLARIDYIAADTTDDASLQALGELTSNANVSFEQLEKIIGADVGLSVGLLRHVNSAFFALPRKIDTVREALTLLGPRAVRRWATVVALSSVPEAPDQVVALALLRGRMCELLGRGASEEERDRLFTVGLFSVADALLDAMA